MSHFAAYNTSDSTTGNTVLAANQTLILGPMQADTAQQVAGSIFTDQSGTLYIEQSFDNGDPNEGSPAYLTTALTTGGGAITSLAVSATPAALLIGATVVTTNSAQGAPDGTNTQQWILSAPASKGATSLSVTSQTPNFNYPVGSAVLAGGFSFDISNSTTITAATPGTGQGASFSQTILAPYVRIRYVNGGTAQGVFRLFSRTFTTGRG
jgi:hypothetical protein